MLILLRHQSYITEMTYYVVVRCARSNDNNMRALVARYSMPEELLFRGDLSTIP